MSTKSRSHVYLGQWTSLFIAGIIIMTLVEMATTAFILPEEVRSGLSRLSGNPAFEFVRQISREAPSLLMSVLFGGMGASARVFAERLANPPTVDVGPVTGENKHLSATKRDLTYIELGGIGGIVGYIVVKSNIILKVLYSGAPEGLTSTWHGVAFATLFFGYFAKEFFGLSKGLLVTRLGEHAPGEGIRIAEASFAEKEPSKAAPS